MKLKSLSVCLGERQKFSVKIDSREISVTKGILLLESQTEGTKIVQLSKVAGLLHSNGIQKRNKQRS